MFCDDMHYYCNVMSKLHIHGKESKDMHQFSSVHRSTKSLSTQKQTNNVQIIIFPKNSVTRQFQETHCSCTVGRISFTRISQLEFTFMKVSLEDPLLRKASFGHCP